MCGGGGRGGLPRGFTLIRSLDSVLYERNASMTLHSNVLNSHIPSVNFLEVLVSCLNNLVNLPTKGHAEYAENSLSSMLSNT